MAENSYKKEEVATIKLTYEDLYREFLACTKVDPEEVNDWRPCTELYGVPYIQCAIIIWLKDKSSLIYMHRRDENGRVY